MANPLFDSCTLDSISPLAGFLTVTELCVSLVSLFMNSALAVCSYQAMPFSYAQRQTLGAISLNYVLISGVVLARSTFIAYIGFTTCNTVMSTATCKIQEFPLVFVYFQAATFPLLLATQFLCEKNHRVRDIKYFNACSVLQLMIAVACLAAALWFTAFDEEKHVRHLDHCLIVRAIHEKSMTFVMFTVLLGLHLATLFLWFLIQRQVAGTKNDSRTETLAKAIIGDNLGWCIILLMSGFVGVYEYVSNERSDKLISAFMEASFVLSASVLTLVRSIYVAWNVMPIRLAILQLFPVSLYFLEVEYDTIYKYNREISGLEKLDIEQ